MACLYCPPPALNGHAKPNLTNKTKSSCQVCAIHFYLPKSTLVVYFSAFFSNEVQQNLYSAVTPPFPARYRQIQVRLYLKT